MYYNRDAMYERRKRDILIGRWRMLTRDIFEEGTIREGGFNLTFVRNFLIAFAIAFALFLPIAYFTVNYVVDEIDKSTNNVTTEPMDSSDQQGGDQGLTPDAVGRLSLLQIVTSPGDPARIEFLTLVHYNLDSRQVVITVLPGDMKVPVKGVDMSLSEGYSYVLSGEYELPHDYVAKVVTACTGISVDSYCTLDLNTFATVADNLGGIRVEFSEAFTIYDGGTRFFPKGVNTLSTADLISLLNYQGYNSPSTRLQMISAVCKSVLDEKCTTRGYLELDDTWAKISQNMEYDLGDFESPHDFAHQFYSYRFCTVVQLGVQGSYVNVNGERLFAVDYNNMIAQMRQYSR